MPEARPPITLADRSLDSLAAALADRRAPPVEQWNPAHCGDSEMRIGADGRWTYRGEPIDRPAMVRLFASVLRREADGGYVLVTPAEKLAIAVDDLPFRAIAMTSEGEREQRRIAFALDAADPVLLGPDNPLRIVESAHGPAPSVRVRGGLEARIVRPVYYELADIALAEGGDGVWSGGAFFSLVGAG